MSGARLAVVLLAGALVGAVVAGEAPLRLYCVYHAAHGFRAISEEFRKRTGIPVGFRLGCRKSFYATVRSAKDGDLYLTTAPANMAAAKEDGLLASEPRVIGSVVPVIVVAKGSPHGIRALADLGREGFVVAYPSTCIGDVALEIIAKNKLNDTVKANMSIRTGNRTGVLGPLAAGKAHAAITWSCAVIESGRKDMETIAIPAEKNVVDPLLIAILKTCQQKARAQAFLDYLATESARKTLKESRLRE